MSKEALKQEINEAANGGRGLAETIGLLYAALARHEDALAGMNASYRLKASDTGYTAAFAIRGGQFFTLDDTSITSVTVTGKEADLLSIFQRKLTPAKALLFGKIKLKGDTSALLKLGELI